MPHHEWQEKSVRCRSSCIHKKTEEKERKKKERTEK